MKKIVIIILFSITMSLSAQDKNKILETDYQNTEVEMADQLRADGKIYVVVTVLAIILSGLILYTVSIDRKISRIEKSVKE
jgi:uncharacterized membrane protein